MQPGNFTSAMRQSLLIWFCNDYNHEVLHSLPSGHMPHGYDSNAVCDAKYELYHTDRRYKTLSRERVRIG